MAFDEQAPFTEQPNGLPDIPSDTLTPTQIKSYFQTPLDELMTTLNNALAKLNSTASGNSGADNTGATGFDGTASNIQVLLNYLKNNKTDLTGDHKGTWQGFTPSQVDQTLRDQVAERAKNIAYIEENKYKNLCPKDVGGTITDWYPAITQALADLKALGGGELQFAIGSYPYTQTPIVDFYCKLVGIGMIPTQLKPIGCDGIKITNPFVQMESINIDSNVIADDTTTTIGINAQDASALYLRAVNVKNMGTGLSINDGADGDTYAGHYGLITGCHFTYNNYGVRINNVANMWNFYGGAIMNNRFKGIELFDTENVNFQGVSIESHPAMTGGQTVNDMITGGKLAIHIRSSVAGSLNQGINSKVTFRDCWFEIGNAYVESGFVTIDSCRLVNGFNIFSRVPINFKNMNKKETSPNFSPPLPSWITGANVVLNTTRQYDATGKRNYHQVTSTAGAGAYKALYALTTDIQGTALDSRLFVGFWIKKITANNNVYPILTITDMAGNSYNANMTTYFPSFNQASTDWQFVGATISVQGTNLNTVLKDCTLRLELADVTQDCTTVNSPTANAEVWVGVNPVIRVLDMEPELIGNQVYARKSQSPWIAPTLQNSWVNYGGTYSPTGYYKDEFGIVHLRGFVRTGTIGQVIFTLPVGFRPLYTMYVATASNGLFGTVKINTDGTVMADSGNNSWFSLENIQFRTDS